MRGQLNPKFGIDLVASGFAVGWVFADYCPITCVVAKRNGQTIAKTSIFHPRPDVAAAYPESIYAELSGFNLSFDPLTTMQLSIVSIFAEVGGTEFLIGEGLTANASNLKQRPIESPTRSHYPADVGNICRIINGEDGITTDKVCALLEIPDLRAVSAISNYSNYMMKCWSHFNFVARFFPKVNTRSVPERKDFVSTLNSSIEMMSIAHHIYALKTYGTEGSFAEFGCFKGFSSSMLSYACSLLDIEMHIYDSIRGPSQICISLL